MGDAKSRIPPEVFHQWVSEPELVCREEFQEIIRISLQKVADIAEKARRYGAKVEFERLHKWLKDNDETTLASQLLYTVGHEHFSLKEQALKALAVPHLGPEQIQIVKKALLTLKD